MADPLANRPHASLPLDVGIVYRDAFFQATYIIFGKTTILPEAGDGDDTTSTAEHAPAIITITTAEISLRCEYSKHS